MKLERLLLQFKSKGFRSRLSLAYVNSDDFDSFFPSPDKLLLAERHVFCQRAESSFFASYVTRSKETKPSQILIET